MVLMIRLYAPHIRPFSDVSYFGVVISGDADQRHIGLLCNSGKNNETHVIHLAFHFRLLREVPDPLDYYWFDCSDVFDEDDRIYMASWLIKVWEKYKDSMPYGLPYSSDHSLFDESKSFSDVSQVDGLTCATFALSVLKLSGFDALNLDSWELRESDVVWQKKIVSMLYEDRRRHPEYYRDYPVEDQEANVGVAVRIRPEEAAAAIHSYSGEPMHFHKASELGACVLSQLLSSTGGIAC